MECNCTRGYVKDETECAVHGSQVLTKFASLTVGAPCEISGGWACPCEPADAEADVTKPPKPVGKETYVLFCKRRDSNDRDGEENA